MSQGTKRITRSRKLTADDAAVEPIPSAPLSLDLMRLIFIEAVRLGARPSELILCKDHLTLLSGAAILLDWEEDAEQAQNDALSQLCRFPSPTTLRKLKIGQFDWQAGLNSFLRSERSSESLARLEELTLNVSSCMHGRRNPEPHPASICSPP